MTWNMKKLGILLVVTTTLFLLQLILFTSSVAEEILATEEQAYEEETSISCEESTTSVIVPPDDDPEEEETDTAIIGERETENISDEVELFNEEEICECSDISEEFVILPEEEIISEIEIPIDEWENLLTSCDMLITEEEELESDDQEICLLPEMMIVGLTSSNENESDVQITWTETRGKYHIVEDYAWNKTLLCYAKTGCRLVADTPSIIEISVSSGNYEICYTGIGMPQFDGNKVIINGDILTEEERTQLTEQTECSLGCVIVTLE